MQTSPNANPTEVLECDDAFFTALLTADDAALDAILADDFLIVDVMGGQVATKKDLLLAMSSGELRFLEVTRRTEEATVRHRESVAVVVGATQLVMNFRGTSATANSRYTHVFVRAEAQWRMLSAQGTPIAG
jgi:ketosteroid isomerase-like protein